MTTGQVLFGSDRLQKLHCLRMRQHKVRHSLHIPSLLCSKNKYVCH